MSEIETEEQGWTLNLLNWFGSSDGATPGLTPDSPLLNLPYEIRGIIWRNVPVKDHQTLRLTCEQIKQDVEENVGVNGKLHGPEPTLAHYVVTGVQYLTGSGDYQGLENAEWLKRVLVRELSVKNLSRMPLLDTRELLKNPAVLTTLSVWLEEEVSGEKLVEIIDQFPSLTTVRILPRLPSKVPWNPIWDPDFSGLQEYNTNTTNILNDALKTLKLKPVKHLEISLDLSLARSLGAFIFVSGSAFFETDLRSNYYIGMQNNAGAAGLLFPTELDTLDIRMPQIRNLAQHYSGNQVPLFKSLLDVQTMLTSLKVRIGPIYWRYFEDVLQNCYQSLKSLEIDVGNWEDPFGIPPCPEPDLGLGLVLSAANQTIPIPEEQCFDWTVLFSPNCNLECLILRMPMRAHVSANGTRNFCLTFANLKKLELEYLKLSPNEFRMILLELPELRDVSIREWSKVEDTPENFLAFKRVTDAAFYSIRQALLLERLTKIVLWEEALSGNIYNARENIRGSIQHPAYTVQWSNYYLRSRTPFQNVPAEDEERYRISRGPSLFISKNE